MTANDEVKVPAHGPLPGLMRQVGDLRLNHPFIRFWLSSRTFNALHNAWGAGSCGYAPTVRHILSTPDERIRQIKGIGVKGIREIGRLRIFVEWDARVDDRDRFGIGRHRR